MDYTLEDALATSPEAAAYTPVELKIKDKLDDLLQLRRRYLVAALKTQELKAEGNEAFDALETEIRASLQLPKPPTKKTKARKE
jgi:hypothetical protein